MKYLEQALDRAPDYLPALQQIVAIDLDQKRPRPDPGGGAPGPGAQRQKFPVSPDGGRTPIGRQPALEALGLLRATGKI